MLKTTKIQDYVNTKFRLANYYIYHGDAFLAACCSYMVILLVESFTPPTHAK